MPSETKPPSGTPGSTDEAALERIDWEEVSRTRRWITGERVTLVIGLIVVGVAYLYFQTQRRTYLLMQWNIGYEDWLLMLSAVLILAYGVVPLARSRRRVVRLLRRLSQRPPTVLSVVFLFGLFFISLWAILRGFQPSLGSLEEGWTVDPNQPPIGATAPFMFAGADCVGEVSGSALDGRHCHGSWEYPLGTDNWGYDMVDLLIVGAQPFAYLGLVTIGLVVPLATVFGMTAGYYGGRVDDLLMSYVNVQISVPAILIYMVAYMFVLNSMFMLLLAFGLLSWGGITRIVRSETLQRREEGYILASKAVGAPDRYILKRHLFPNVTNTVIPATFHLIAILVLTEAGLAFIGFHASFQSWGMTIAEGVFYGAVHGELHGWWISTFPAIALALTVVALKVAGDGLRDILDPRGET